MDVSAIRPIDKNEMAILAREEYDRLLVLLKSLPAVEWNNPTVCTGWTVKDMVAHLVGAAESNASVAETFRQLFHGSRIARSKGAPTVDGINEFQVKQRRHMTPVELVDRLADVGDKAIKGRAKTPRLVRKIKLTDPTGGKMTMGHLVDVIYTRDEWLHRNDVAEATGRPFMVTSAHDGRIVEDVVREWAGKHRSPVVLNLTGSAGGCFELGKGGEHISLDAVEFCKMLSGRISGQIPIKERIAF